MRVRVLGERKLATMRLYAVGQRSVRRFSHSVLMFPLHYTVLCNECRKPSTWVRQSLTRSLLDPTKDSRVPTHHRPSPLPSAVFPPFLS